MDHTHVSTHYNSNQHRHDVAFITSSLNNNGGIGRFQRWLLLYTGLAWAGDACETMLLSFLGPSVVCAWPEVVGPLEESLLTSMVFVGMMVGVSSLGATADVLGRRTGFLLSASVLGVAGLASAFAPSFAVLLLLRTVVGGALGGTPIAVTLFSEFLPNARRGSFVLVLQAFWTVGTVGEALLAWWVLPWLGWRWLLGLSALPMFVLLLGYPWLPESPHWLVSQGRVDEAVAVVKRVVAVNGSSSSSSSSSIDKTSRSGNGSGGGGEEGGGEGALLHRSNRSVNGMEPTSRVDNGVLDDGSPIAFSSPLSSASSSPPYSPAALTTMSSLASPDSATAGIGGGVLQQHQHHVGLLQIFLNFFHLSLPKIFSAHLAKTSFLLWIIWFVNAVTYYGLVLLTTTLQQQQNSNSNLNEPRARCTPEGRPNFSSADFAAILLTSLAEAPGLAVAAFFVDSKGRTVCLRSGLFMCACCVLGLVAVPTSRVSQLVMLFASRACIEGTFSVLYVYTPELYPTSVRSTGLALCNTFSRLGGFAAPFVSVYLVESGRTAVAEVVLAVLLFVGAVAAMALPFETKGVDLSVAGREDGEEEEHL